jgi:rod shape-determining protein MreC
LTKYYHLIIFSVLALFFLLGSKDFRYRKADFLSKTIYHPFIFSVKLIESHLNLKGENLQLHNKVARQQIELNNLRQELNYYQRQAMDFTAPVYDYITAEVVSSNGNYGQRFYILDQGSNAGLKPNMPVLGTEGIIGKIVTVGHNYSLLMPFSHTNFKLGVMLQKNFVHGLLEADLEGVVSMNMLRVGSAVSLGDTLVSSHFSTTFPPFYPVGTVKRIRIAPDKINLQAEIEPFSDLQSMTTVIVLLYESKHDYQKELGLEDEIRN